VVRWTDEYVDRLIGHLLRGGVLLSAVVVLFGGGLYLTRHGGETSDRRTFYGEPAEFRHFVGIIQAATDGSARGVIALGLLLLVATPIARVALAAFGFLREHDWLYTGVAAFVLGVLLISLAVP
jgi:uncharacterized membrane protein